MIHRNRDGVRWELSADFEPLFARVLESPAETVKCYLLRSVTRHRLDGRVFYIKRYLHGNHPWLPAKYLFKLPESRREWRLAPRLVELEVAVVPHWAHGERWSWRGLLESVLITEGPAGFVGLKEMTALDRPELQHALGRFVRQMHQAAVFHKDLHVDNLLYSPTANALCLVDLDNIVPRSRLSVEERMDNLATLNRRLPLTRVFYERYGEDFARLAEHIARLSEAKYRAAVPRYVELSLRPGQTFVPRRFGALKWQVRLPCLNDQLEGILKDPDAFLSRQARLLKPGRSSTVGCGHGLVLKRSNLRKVRNLFIDLFRRSRSRQAFCKARHLELLDIASARPVATADRRRFGLPWRSYFVMEEIPGAVQLHSWRGDKREAIRRVATLLAKLHQEGFAHRDLWETNIVFDAQGQPYLLDLDGLRYVRQTSDRRAAANLTRLARAMTELLERTWDTGLKPTLTRTDRLRFLKNYCECRGRNDWRWWWRQIERKLRVAAAH